MNPSPFEGCWLRIDRAEAHRKASSKIWNDFIEQNPFDFMVDHEGEGHFVMRVVQEVPTPPELAILMGEWLYNLRCALDYTMYAAAVVVTEQDPPPGAGQLQFPICFQESQFRDNQYRMKSLADHHSGFIESMQPYRHDEPDTSALGWLNKLARIDRHRRLTIVTAHVAEATPRVEVPDGCKVDVEFGKRVIVNGEAEVGRLTVVPWVDGAQIWVNPGLGIDPEVMEWADSAFWRQIGYNERLSLLSFSVQSMVAMFEYDCLGQTRMEHILTDTFRSECDAKRRQGRSSSASRLDASSRKPRR